MTNSDAPLRTAYIMADWEATNHRASTESVSCSTEQATIEGIGGVALEAGHHVGVRVERDANPAMAQAFAHDLWVDTSSQQHRRVAVAQVVEADHRHARLLDQRMKRVASEVPRPQRLPVEHGEAQAKVVPVRPELEVILVLLGLVLPQRLDDLG